MPSETIGVIADRYASALFELAENQGALDQVASDLKTLKAMIKDSPDLRRLIVSPVLTRAQAGKALAALAESAKFGVLTSNFLGLAAKNRRLFALDEIINAYLSRLAARRGEISAHVVSSVELSQAQREALEASVKSVHGGNVVVDVAVDPSLLGGMIVKVGSRMVDSSLKTKLQHLKLAMKGVG